MGPKLLSYSAFGLTHGQWCEPPCSRQPSRRTSVSAAHSPTLSDRALPCSDLHWNYRFQLGLYRIFPLVVHIIQARSMLRFVHFNIRIRSVSHSTEIFTLDWSGSSVIYYAPIFHYFKNTFLIKFKMLSVVKHHQNE